MRTSLSYVATAALLVTLLGAGCQSLGSSTTEQTTPPTTPTSTGETTSSNSFTIAAEAQGKGAVQVRWSTPSDAKPNSVFRVVYGPNNAPSLPGSRWYARSSNDYHDATITGVPAGTMHFRMCEWNNNTCLRYSNEVLVEVK